MTTRRVQIGEWAFRCVEGVPEAWLQEVARLGHAHIAGLEGGRASGGFVIDLPAELAGRVGCERGYVKVMRPRGKHTPLRRLRSSRAVDEFEAAVRFAAAGIAAHVPVCAGEVRGLGGRGALTAAVVVTGLIEGASGGPAETAAGLFSRTGDEGVLIRAARVLASIHSAGLTHGDARLENFVEGAGGMRAIDLCQAGQCDADEDGAVLVGTARTLGATARMEKAMAEAMMRTPTEVATLRAAEKESQRAYGYKIIGAKGAHDALRAELDRLAPCDVLDAPAGEGILSEFLRLRGHRVQCADIDPGNFRLPHLPLRTIDLNRGLPFEDASFDAVVCANAVHRLYNPAGCIRELARVARPGARVYINVNNYANIEKRLRFLVYGSLDNQVNSSIAQQSTDAPEANLRVGIHLPIIVNALERAGLVIERVRPSAMTAVHWGLLPLGLLFAGAGFLIGPRSRKRNALRHTNGWGVLPGGKYVLIVARKPGAGDAKVQA